MKRIKFIGLIIVAILAPNIFAQEYFDPENVYCRFPLVESPFNTTLKAWPSMDQSLNFSKCAYLVGHKYIPQVFGGDISGWRSSFLQRLEVGIFDLAMFYIPPGEAWLHEEWHRAVMSRRGISSYNEVYNFDIGSEAIKVSHVKDSELIALKKHHNPDLVRLAEAGNESSYELNLAVEKDEFFRGTDTFDQILLLANYANAIYYVVSGSSKDADSVSTEMEKKENTEEKRDFVGHDFTSWVYDLHRPDEPYEARGVHPSGNGIDRYRLYGDLSNKEKRFLKLQGALSFLNLLDPFLLRKTHFMIKGNDENPTYWNASLRHHLTSFGYLIETNLFYKVEKMNFFLGLKSYQNDKRAFPGLALELFEYPFMSEYFISLRGMVWEQPYEQRFYTSSGRTGGLLGARLSRVLHQAYRGYFETEAKTEGWVAGNPFLDKNLTFRLGMEMIL